MFKKKLLLVVLSSLLIFMSFVGAADDKQGEKQKPSEKAIAAINYSLSRGIIKEKGEKQKFREEVTKIVNKKGK